MVEVGLKMPVMFFCRYASLELPNLVLPWNVAGIPPPEGSDDAQLLTMSTLNEDGVMNVKQVACDRLLSSRVETKLQVGRRRCSCCLLMHLHLHNCL